MSDQTIIDIATVLAVSSTALTAIATSIHLWRRHRILQRDAKLPHGGSRQPSLDPDRNVASDQDADVPDTDSLAPGFDPDRPAPPSDLDADEPDAVEEEAHHG